MLGLFGADDIDTDVVVVGQVSAVAGTVVDAVVSVSAVVVLVVVVGQTAAVVGERANACMMFCCDKARSL